MNFIRWEKTCRDGKAGGLKFELHSVYFAPQRSFDSMRSLRYAVLQSGVPKERNINTAVGKPLEDPTVCVMIT